MQKLNQYEPQAQLKVFRTGARRRWSPKVQQAHKATTVRPRHMPGVHFTYIFPTRPKVTSQYACSLTHNKTPVLPHLRLISQCWLANYEVCTNNENITSCTNNENTTSSHDCQTSSAIWNNRQRHHLLQRPWITSIPVSYKTIDSSLLIIHVQNSFKHDFLGRNDPWSHNLRYCTRSSMNIDETVLTNSLQNNKRYV